ncbi:hypothetical protein ACFSFZ_12940 [Mixta tenebrionis]|uniref:hypothetical protein n=1 Tax=Mixta tenebrionis TaxID=2562439 RepID=UPI0013626056|nr:MULTISPECIES: hypothetical protein [Mixta]
MEDRARGFYPRAGEETDDFSAVGDPTRFTAAENGIRRRKNLFFAAKGIYTLLL